VFSDGHRCEMRSCTQQRVQEEEVQDRSPELDGTVSQHPWPTGPPSPFRSKSCRRWQPESRLVCHLKAWQPPNAAHQHGLRKWRCALRLPRRLLHFAVTPENRTIQPHGSRFGPQAGGEEGRSKMRQMPITAYAESTNACRVLQEHIHLPTANWTWCVSRFVGLRAESCVFF
jgi:hypothetical protein